MSKDGIATAQGRSTSQVSVFDKGRDFLEPRRYAADMPEETAGAETSEHARQVRQACTKLEAHQC